MLKSKMIRKVMLVVCVVFLVGLSGCKKDKDEKVVSENVVTTSDENTQTNNRDTQAQNTETNETSETQEGNGGGNKYNNDSENKITKFNVLVSNDEYYYNNAPILFDELISTIQSSEEETMVIVSDNNATHKSYKKLIDKLIELEIPYEEK